MKDLWIAEHEQILEDYCSELITRDEAMNRLKRLGIDPIEADEQLAECVS